MATAMVAAAAVGAAAAVIIAAEPAGAVLGRVVVNATSVADSNSPKGASALCPAGTVALGGGAKITGAAHHVRLIRSATLFGADWVVSAREDSHGYTGSWSVTAWVICAPAPSGYEVVTSTVVGDPGDSNAITVATCPSGKKVLGLGGNAYNGVGVLHSIAPSLALTSVGVMAVVDEVSYLGSGQLMVTATAICVDPLAGQQSVQADVGWGSPINATITAPCPASTVLHGLGFVIVVGPVPWDETQLVALYPSRTGATLYVEEDSTGNAEPWDASVYAICAQ
jgi:hypothetical protein